MCLNCDGEQQKNCDLCIEFLEPLKVQKEAAGRRFVLLLVQPKTTTHSGGKIKPTIACFAIYCSVVLLMMKTTVASATLSGCYLRESHVFPH